MQTIHTKYLPATDTRGERIKASALGSTETVVVHWVYNLTLAENHRMAAITLCEQLGLSDMMIGGHTEEGMVWVSIHGPNLYPDPE